MDGMKRSWWDRGLKAIRWLFWIAVVLVILQQLLGTSRTATARAELLDELQQERQSRVIAMIHRLAPGQETQQDAPASREK